MGRQSRICLSIVVSIRFYAVRQCNMFVQKKTNILLCILIFYIILGGNVCIFTNLSQSRGKIICLSKLHYIKSSSGILAYHILDEYSGESFRGCLNGHIGSMSSISGASSRSVLSSILKFSMRAIGLSNTFFRSEKWLSVTTPSPASMK